jgi:hypothetical protein
MRATLALSPRRAISIERLLDAHVKRIHRRGRGGAAVGLGAADATVDGAAGLC